MSTVLKTKGKLDIGVLVDGVVHRDFEVRTATVQDNIEATEELLERGEEPIALRISTALISRQLVKLGTLIPHHESTEEVPAQITTDLLRGMHPRDWNKIDKASAELEKKLLRDGPIQSEIGGLPVALGATATESIQTS